MTTREVAALLRVKERKVYELAAAGEIPCRRLTGKLLFPKEEVEAWLGAGAAPSEQPAEVFAGSHDPLLDWALRASGSGLASLFDGSLDGLERMARRAAIGAGVHIHEPEEDGAAAGAEGGWNVGHVRRLLAGRSVVLLEWARRRRGLILRPGLEGEVRELRALAGRRVVRRQPSAGAAVLWPHLVARAGLAPGSVQLTAEVARTETEAAVEVAQGRADAALGLEAAARQVGLPFVPLLEERFDLALDRRAYFEPPLQALAAFVRTPAFAGKAAALGGYEVGDALRVVWNAP